MIRSRFTLPSARLVLMLMVFGSIRSRLLKNLRWIATVLPNSVYNPEKEKRSRNTDNTASTHSFTTLQLRPKDAHEFQLKIPHPAMDRPRRLRPMHFLLDDMWVSRSCLKRSENMALMSDQIQERAALKTTRVAKRSFGATCTRR